MDPGILKNKIFRNSKKVSNREYGLHVHALRGGINRNEYAPGEMLPVHYFYLSIFL